MAYSLSPRENNLLAMQHKPTEFIPGISDSAYVAYMDSFEKGPAGGGLDGFGVNWVYSKHSGLNGPIPEPGNFVLTDVTQWKKTVSFPDLDLVDWEAKAEKDLAAHNTDLVAIEYASGNAHFERLAALMGFEGALIAMIEEPEATFDLLSAITDFKIAVMKKAAKYYKPDMFTYHDDIATEQRLFMSPEIYRQLIKPQHKRLNSACWNEGIMPVFHCCGKADECIDDYIEAGAAAWSFVQKPNDIVGILEKYKGRYTLKGGYDWQGPAGMADASDEVVDQEITRMLAEYSLLDGFIGNYMNLSPPANPDPDAPPWTPEESMAARIERMKRNEAIVREFEATQWRK
jgi:hypothetical protein